MGEWPMELDKLLYLPCLPGIGPMYEWCWFTLDVLLPEVPAILLETTKPELTCFWWPQLELLPAGTPVFFESA